MRQAAIFSDFSMDLQYLINLDYFSQDVVLFEGSKIKQHPLGFEIIS
jgi:hypothetical protein